MVDGVLVEPPTPAYSPPSNDNIPPLPLVPSSSSDAGLLEYTRLHGHSDMPLSPRQREDDNDDRTSVHASEAEALPAYRADHNPPRYSHRRLDSEEPMTWPAISFRIGFRTFLSHQTKFDLPSLRCYQTVFPIFWLFGALTLITPQDSLDRIFMPWFKDFAPSAASWRDTLQTEAEKEAYSARMRIAEKRWAKRCLSAFSLLLCLVGVIVGTAVGVSKIH